MTSEEYAEYQHETWESHRAAFRALWFLSNQIVQKVYDIGCGETPFVRAVLPATAYKGVDKEEADFSTPIGRQQIVEGIGDFNADLVTSTFATEVFLNYSERRAFYENIIDKNKCVKHILLSGVCYPAKPGRHEMFMPFKHYVSPPYPVYGNGFREYVHVQTVNSKLFGAETEVWRILSRNTVD